MPGLRSAGAMNFCTSGKYSRSCGGDHLGDGGAMVPGARGILRTGSRPCDVPNHSAAGARQWSRDSFFGAKPKQCWDDADARSGDRDLQAMVHDFIENEACGDYVDGGDGDGGLSDGSTLSEHLQVCVKVQSAQERELLGDVQRLLLGANEATDLVCGADCKGACIKRFVVKRLKLASYSAAVCRSAWAQAPGRVPGGEYEYVEVVARGAAPLSERLIVDVSFQAQFEIARPTAQYAAAVQSLPAVFVGAAGKLEQVLCLMSDAARASLEQNDMHLPPWRTLQYMRAKWLSKFTTTSAAAAPLMQWRPSCQCGRDELRRTKVSLLAETKPAHRGRSSRANLLLHSTA